MEDRPPRVVKAKKIPEKPLRKGKGNNIHVLAKLCYYYPQYTLREARNLPYKQVVMLIRTAETLQAYDYIHRLQIAIAPHAKEGGKIMMDYFTKMANGE